MTVSQEEAAFNAKMKGRRMSWASKQEVADACAGGNSGMLTLETEDEGGWKYKIEVKVDRNGCFLELGEVSITDEKGQFRFESDFKSGLYSLISSQFDSVQS